MPQAAVQLTPGMTTPVVFLSEIHVSEHSSAKLTASCSVAKPTVLCSVVDPIASCSVKKPTVSCIMTKSMASCSEIARLRLTLLLLNLNEDPTETKLVN